jgi:hypothetical protein
VERSDIPYPEVDQVRLFKRKDEVLLVCPDCREPVPAKVVECAMCGRDLHNTLADPDARFTRAEETSTNTQETRVS